MGFWRDALGLTICTILLLAVSLAIYDLLTEFFTLTNVLVATVTYTWRQFAGQLLFAIILFILCIVALFFFHPFSESKTNGIERGWRDVLKTREAIPAVVRL
jgi:hypothetical protein